MEFVQEKLNLGRAIAKLDLEGLVLRNGVLPKHKLMERASLVKGMIEGLIEKGRWQEAVRMVYKQDSVVRGLFDGDTEALQEQVFSSIDAGKTNDWKDNRDTIDEHTVRLLYDHWDAQAIYRLAVSPGITNGESVYHGIAKDLTEEQKAAAHNRFGNRNLEKGELTEAYANFVCAKNTDRINELYEKFVEQKEFAYALRIIKDDTDPENRKKRIAEVVKIVAGSKKQRESYNEDLAAKLISLVEDNKVRISAREKNHLLDTIAGRAYRPEKLDDDMRLRWAKKHATSDPSKAYEIMVEQDYNGPERIEAVRTGLESTDWDHRHLKIEISEIRPEDLQAIRNEVSLDIQTSIAERLKDKEELLMLSGVYAGKAEDAKEEQREIMLHRAYDAWRAGDGDNEAQYIDDIRAKLIKEDLKDKGRAYFSWLDFGDVRGHFQAFDACMSKDCPGSAYDNLRRLDTKDPRTAQEQEAKLQTARESIVRKSPEFAMDYFVNNTDSKGTRMALQALESKYGLAPNELMPFITERFEGNEKYNDFVSQLKE